MQQTDPEERVSSLRAHVTSVNLSAVHDFSKSPAREVRLLQDLGVEGDAHCGTTVRHRFDRRRNPERPNLRQVHLIATELLDELAQHGRPIRPGDLGENVTTTGVDLMALPHGTVLRLGEEAQVRLTGVRTPCRLIDSLQPGLMKQLWDVDEAGQRVRKAGVMAVVVTGGAVRAGDPLTVVLPPRHTSHSVLCEVGGPCKGSGACGYRWVNFVTAASVTRCMVRVRDPAPRSHNDVYLRAEESWRTSTTAPGLLP